MKKERREERGEVRNEQEQGATFKYWVPMFSGELLGWLSGPTGLSVDLRRGQWAPGVTAWASGLQECGLTVRSRALFTLWRTSLFIVLQRSLVDPVFNASARF